ncbi:hypothetical protein E1298_42545, partial [Actinomadura rubrisoli]
RRARRPGTGAPGIEAPGIEAPGIEAPAAGAPATAGEPEAAPVESAGLRVAIPHPPGRLPRSTTATRCNWHYARCGRDGARPGAGIAAEHGARGVFGTLRGLACVKGVSKVLCGAGLSAPTGVSPL